MKSTRIAVGKYCYLTKKQRTKKLRMQYKKKLKGAYNEKD